MTAYEVKIVVLTTFDPKDLVEHVTSFLDCPRVNVQTVEVSNPLEREEEG